MVYIQGQISKAEILRRHAARAARERYGEVSEETKRQIRRLIRRSIKIVRENRKHPHHEPVRPPAIFLNRNRATQRSVWSVTIDDTRYRVVYEEATDRLVTFLPPTPDKGRRT